MGTSIPLPGLRLWNMENCYPVPKYQDSSIRSFDRFHRADRVLPAAVRQRVPAPNAQDYMETSCSSNLSVGTQGSLARYIGQTVEDTREKKLARLNHSRRERRVA